MVPEGRLGKEQSWQTLPNHVGGEAREQGNMETMKPGDMEPGRSDSWLMAEWPDFAV